MNEFFEAENNSPSMMDVASGALGFNDFLKDRFSEEQLKSKIEVDPKSKLDEVVAPRQKKRHDIKPKFNDDPFGLKKQQPTLDEGSSGASESTVASSPAVASDPVAPPPAGPAPGESLEEWVQRFHSAAQEYQKKQESE